MGNMKVQYISVQKITVINQLMFHIVFWGICLFYNNVIPQLDNDQSD